MFFAMEGRPQAGEGMELAAAVVRSVPVVLLADQGSRVNSGASHSSPHTTGSFRRPADTHKSIHIHMHMRSRCALEPRTWLLT